MSGRNRFADAAIGLVVGLGIALFLLAWAVPEFRDPTYWKAADQGYAGQANGIISTEKDTLAQWTAAVSALISVGISIWAVWLVRSTLKANTEAVGVGREANSIAADSSEKQLRAYIHVTSVKLEHANDEYAPTITVNYKNFGQTPARNVVNRLSVSFVILGSAMRRNREDSDERGYDLGPGQDSSTSVHISFERGLVTRDMLVKNLAKLYVMGEITYKDTFGKEDRYTRYKLFLHPEPEAVVDTDAFVVCPDGNEGN